MPQSREPQSWQEPQTTQIMFTRLNNKQRVYGLSKRQEPQKVLAQWGRQVTKHASVHILEDQQEEINKPLGELQASVTADLRRPLS